MTAGLSSIVDAGDAAMAGLARHLGKVGWPFPRRAKGDAGQVIVVGGSARYPGSPILAARAALRAAVDDVRAVVPADARAVPLGVDVHLHTGGADDLGPDAGQVVERTGHELLRRCQQTARGQVVVLVGPGLGGHPDPAEVLTAVAAACQRLRRVHVVVDGNLAGGLLGWERLRLLAPAVVLLNHREAAGLNLASSHRRGLAAAARRLDTVLVAKGPIDHITAPTGVALRPRLDGARELTKSGTGDVLAGAVAALLAHGIAPAAAAEIGCWLVQAASRIARDRHGPGFLASELADHLSTALHVAEGTP
ncbi:NAD(P)H-hydrate dehydratase [Micromonospora sp. CA-263727]|uniref:NAD(P)H-hydrate dehydratase n=1 Tax=Micromonospora sp. CA-263727 TaxID=3239967 RepID=UPI003D8B6485